MLEIEGMFLVLGESQCQPLCALKILSSVQKAEQEDNQETDRQSEQEPTTKKLLQETEEQQQPEAWQCKHTEDLTLIRSPLD